MADYKAAKEAWVTGLQGSDLLDVALVGLAVPVRATSVALAAAWALTVAAPARGSSAPWCTAWSAA